MVSLIDQSPSASTVGGRAIVSRSAGQPASTAMDLPHPKADTVLTGAPTGGLLLLLLWPMGLQVQPQESLVQP